MRGLMFIKQNDNDKYTNITTILSAMLQCSSVRMCCQHYKIVLWNCRPYVSKNISRTLTIIKSCGECYLFLLTAHLFNALVYFLFVSPLLFNIPNYKLKLTSIVFKLSGVILVSFAF